MLEVTFELLEERITTISEELAIALSQSDGVAEVD